MGRAAIEDAGESHHSTSLRPLTWLKASSMFTRGPRPLSGIQSHSSLVQDLAPSRYSVEGIDQGHKTP